MNQDKVLVQKTIDGVTQYQTEKARGQHAVDANMARFSFDANS